MARSNQASLFLWVFAGLVLSVMSRSVEDQKTYYSPDPSAGSHGGHHHHGSSSPSHGTVNCVNPPPSHTPTPSVPSHTPTPSIPSHTPTPSAPSYTPTPSVPSPHDPHTPTPSVPSHTPTPSAPSYTPTPSVPSPHDPHTPSHHPSPSTPSHHPSPSTPSHHPSPSTPSHTPTPSTPSHGGGYYPSPSIPTPSVPTPSVPTPSVPTPSIPTPYVPTPSIPTPSVPGFMPTPPFPDPNNPFTGTCNFWRSHPTLIWGVLGWWGTLGNVFDCHNIPGFPSSLSLPQALSNTRTDGLGALYREGTASLLNSMVNHRFPFTTEQVRNSFVAALSSDKAAAAQAKVFKLANEGRLKPRD